MPGAHTKMNSLLPRLALCLVGATLTAGCVSLPKRYSFGLGGVDPNSTVAAEVNAASRSTGRFPRFADIPVKPTDVRPETSWKTAVLAEQGLKTYVQAQSTAIPFTLNGTGAWATAERAKISPVLSGQAPADARAQAEAFAAAQAARATPPPPPH